MQNANKTSMFPRIMDDSERLERLCGLLEGVRELLNNCLVEFIVRDTWNHVAVRQT